MYVHKKAWAFNRARYVRYSVFEHFAEISGKSGQISGKKQIPLLININISRLAYSLYDSIYIKKNCTKFISEKFANTERVYSGLVEEGVCP